MMFNDVEQEPVEIYKLMEKFGKYQKIQSLYACLPILFMTMNYINYVFIAGDINYRCRIPECERYNSTWRPNSNIDRCSKPLLEESGVQACTNANFSDALGECTDWVYETNDTVVAALNLACQPWKINLIGTIHNVGMLLSTVVSGWLADSCRIPECERYNSTWRPNSNIDRCSKPLLQESGVQACTNANFSDALGECTDWVYETNDTVVAALNLACQPWKINLIGTIHNVGMLMSTVVSGWLADRFGRKPVLIFCTIGTCIGHFKVLATSYDVYIVIEMVEAMVSGGAYSSAMILMLEIGGRKSRILSSVFFSYAIYTGEALFALIAMFVPYWKNLIGIIYTPPIFILVLLFLIKESPRWQILNGQTDNAKDILLYISDVNKININREKLKSLDEDGLRKEFKVENYEQNEGCMAILKSREIMKRVLIGAFCEFTANFVYYGLMVNSVHLPGNKYTNFILSSIMSFPGELLAMYSMNTVGRKLPLICGYIFGGLLCAGSGWVSEDNTWLKIMLFLFGKLVVSVCYTGIVTYTMELYPTTVRGSLLGVCSLASGIGSILAPLTPILNTISIVLPSMFFCGTALISGALLTLTPETKHLPLMDTIDQVNKINQKNKMKKKHKYVNEEINHGFEPHA